MKSGSSKFNVQVPAGSEIIVEKKFGQTRLHTDSQALGVPDEDSIISGFSHDPLMSSVRSHPLSGLPGSRSGAGGRTPSNSWQSAGMNSVDIESQLDVNLGMDQINLGYPQQATPGGGEKQTKFMKKMDQNLGRLQDILERRETKKQALE